jgi:alcohol dehydrogenase class IV
MVGAFNFSKIPEIHFGNNKLTLLPQKVKYFGGKLLLVTGKSSFIQSKKGNALLKFLSDEGIVYEIISFGGEPTASFIDEVCKTYCYSAYNVVVSIGGGSVIDAGKAISAMLTVDEPIETYLEGSSTFKPHPGSKLPFIAIPTTAGTGSEATKNAVISQIGENGFKRSLRHNNFVPDLAIIDPELTVNCPPIVTSASGLDAFTQLFESYVSTQSSAFTDGLSYDGMVHVQKSLRKVYSDPHDIDARTDMSYAALLSGISLAHAGLGTIHGFASSIGAAFDIPHGVICGTLLGEVNRFNIELLSKSDNFLVLQKYVQIGKLFSDVQGKSDEYYIHSLVDSINTLINDLQIPKLSKFGVSITDSKQIALKTSNKNNPINFSVSQLETILNNRI